MALGILEPRVEHVPGTVYVYETEQRHTELLENAQHLKTDTKGQTILIPQPSDDPNDPLVSALSVGNGWRSTDFHFPRIGLSGNATSSLESSASSHVWQQPPLLSLRPTL